MASLTPDASDADVMRTLAHAPGDALPLLYDRYAGLVYGLALRILATPAEAEDLTQDVFCSLVTATSYDPTRGTLSAYLVTFTRSRAIDRLRARTRTARLQERCELDPSFGPIADSPAERVGLAERSALVRNALAGLPADQRRVLELSYFQDLSQTEIAAELDTPLGTVKTWSRKGLLSLRAKLGSLIG